MGWLVSDDGDERDARRDASSYKYGGRPTGGNNPVKTQEQADAEAEEAKAKQAEEAKKAALLPITRLRPLVGQAIKVDNLVFQIVCEEEMVLLKYGKIWKGDGTFVSYDNDVLYSTETGWAHTPRRGCEEKAKAIQALRSYADPQGD